MLSIITSKIYAPPYSPTSPSKSEVVVNCDNRAEQTKIAQQWINSGTLSRGSGSYVEAWSYFKKAADLDYAEGHLHLGYARRYGEGVKQDFSEAFQHFKNAADRGSSVGLVELGTMYFYGHSVKADPNEAFQCYLKAAKQGNTNALLKLADMHTYGQGIPKDASEALVCCKQAAGLGDINGWQAFIKKYEEDPTIAAHDMPVTTLTSLNWSYRNMSDSAAYCVGEMLKTNQTITVLNLSNSGIKEIGVQHIAQALDVNHTVEQLDLRGNTLSEPAKESLCNLIKLGSASALTTVLVDDPVLSKTLSELIEVRDKQIQDLASCCCGIGNLKNVVKSWLGMTT